MAACTNNIICIFGARFLANPEKYFISAEGAIFGVGKKTRSSYPRYRYRYLVVQKKKRIIIVSWLEPIIIAYFKIIAPNWIRG